MSFYFYHQHDAMDCGPTSLKMISRIMAAKLILSKAATLLKLVKKA